MLSWKGEPMQKNLQSKIEKLQEILKKHDLPDNLLTLHAGFEALPERIIKDAIEWIDLLNQTLMADLEKIWKLLPLEIWNRYRVWGGFDGHQEVVLLKTCREAVVKSLYKRPKLFNKRWVERELKRIKTSVSKAGKSS